ncbi:hypothetical protein JOB18_017319 [Solea senegalensis]|uniref:Uncharacterized protein n=1 Tax=Solea senegalensis TaxID=28829 RepID=A0AAV6T673_SOLSE|nr:hypothetical protein JOB18_017319 [Solea senegalensis]
MHEEVVGDGAKEPETGVTGFGVAVPVKRIGRLSAAVEQLFTVLSETLAECEEDVDGQRRRPLLDKLQKPELQRKRLCVLSDDKDNRTFPFV